MIHELYNLAPFILPFVVLAIVLAVVRVIRS